MSKKLKYWMCLNCFTMNGKRDVCYHCGRTEAEDTKETRNSVDGIVGNIERLKAERGKGEFDCATHGLVAKYMLDPVLIRFGCEACSKTERDSYQKLVFKPIDIGS